MRREYCRITFVRVNNGSIVLPSFQKVSQSYYESQAVKKLYPLKESLFLFLPPPISSVCDAEEQEEVASQFGRSAESREEIPNPSSPSSFPCLQWRRSILLPSCLFQRIGDAIRAILPKWSCSFLRLFKGKPRNHVGCENWSFPCHRIASSGFFGFCSFFDFRIQTCADFFDSALISLFLSSLLTQAGVDIASFKDGTTALPCWLQNNHADVVSFLLEHGAPTKCSWSRTTVPRWSLQNCLIFCRIRPWWDYFVLFLYCFFAAFFLIVCVSLFNLYFVVVIFVSPSFSSHSRCCVVTARLGLSFADYCSGYRPRRSSWNYLLGSSRLFPLHSQRSLTSCFLECLLEWERQFHVSELSLSIDRLHDTERICVLTKKYRGNIQVQEDFKMSILDESDASMQFLAFMKVMWNESILSQMSRIPMAISSGGSECLQHMSRSTPRMVRMLDWLLSVWRNPCGTLLSICWRGVSLEKAFGRRNGCFCPRMLQNGQLFFRNITCHRSTSAAGLSLWHCVVCWLSVCLDFLCCVEACRAGVSHLIVCVSCFFSFLQSALCDIVVATCRSVHFQETYDNE